MTRLFFPLNLHLLYDFVESLKKLESWQAVRAYGVLAGSDPG